MPPAMPTSAPSPASPTELAGELEPAQTLTTTFRMANVDMDRRRTIDRAAFHALMAEAAESGAYDLPRREGSDHITPIPGMTATIMTRVAPTATTVDGRTINATDPDLLTEAEMAGRRQALEYARFLVDRVPGLRTAPASSASAASSACARRAASTATTA